MSNININSDFTDYYDILHNKNSEITYNRFISNCKQRGTALKYLRSIGIKTIDIKPVNQYIGSDGNIVVYTNPLGHSGAGKKIMTVADAQVQYNNCIASKYYTGKDNYTIKFIQIGKRRITLCFKKSDQITLEMGKLVDIKESPSDFNRLVGLPIFSIDYISDGQEMIAIDFNEVEILKNVFIDTIIKPEEIVNEIIDSLIIYNKC